MIEHIASVLGFNAPDTLWSCLFPLTYVFHIAEEYGGGKGFSAHLSKTRGFNLSPPRFLLITTSGLVLMIAGIIIAERFRFPQFMLVVYGAAVLANGLSHAASGVLKREYNPGLVTGVLLWVPQGALTLARLSGGMSGGRLLMGVVLGLGVQVSATLISLSGGRIAKPDGVSASSPG
jgi:hypothetical protein